MDVTIYIISQLAVMALSLLLALYMLVRGHRMAHADAEFRVRRSLMVAFLLTLAAHSLSGCFIVHGEALEVHATQPLTLLYAAFAVLTLWGSAAMGRRHHQRLTTWTLMFQIPAVLLVVNALMLLSGHYRPIMVSADLLDYQVNAPVVFFGRVIFMAMLLVCWLTSLGMFVEEWLHYRGTRGDKPMEAQAAFSRCEVRLLCCWAALLLTAVVPFTLNFTPPHFVKNFLLVAALLWTAFVYQRLVVLTRERLTGTAMGRLLAGRLPVVLSLSQGGTTPWHTSFTQNPFFTNGHPALDEVAGVLGVDRDQLSYYVHQTLGTNFLAWVSEQRLRYCASELAHGRRKLAELASACGYNDQATFTRAFKRQYGVVPSEYRRKASD